MRGLTLRPPWAYAVAQLGKRTENRTWRPPRGLLGKLLAVHAAGHPLPGDDDAVRAVATIAGVIVPGGLHRGCIVAVARVAGVVTSAAPPPDDPWFVGPFGWLLTDVQALPVPVPCKGGQGLWRVPRRVVTRVHAALRAGHNG